MRAKRRRILPLLWRRLLEAGRPLLLLDLLLLLLLLLLLGRRLHHRELLLLHARGVDRHVSVRRRLRVTGRTRQGEPISRLAAVLHAGWAHTVS